jgi:hypothetical protein
MSVQHRYRFKELGSADLVVDALYEGGNYNDIRDDPIAPLVGGGNQGGFRYLGSPSGFTIRHCILYSDLADPDWPDYLNIETGIFTYYGDNKQPGGELHSTQRSGNLILRGIFDRLHCGDRQNIPPIFIFTKGVKGRDVIFRGLAVPGANGVSQTEDLVAVWKSKSGQRFQNYRAIFTILDVPIIARTWIEDLRSKESITRNAPESWLDWRSGGRYNALAAPAVKRYRTPEEQLPKDKIGRRLLQHIVAHYERHPEGPYGFERCAATIVKMMDANIVAVDLTRPWRDGGRDALGKYRIGPGLASITVDFALEAKCKTATNGSGVRETARLVARLRYRQFGIFVTTSYVATQAYQELVEDDHPVIVLAGVDLVGILMANGIGSIATLNSWLLSIDQL